MGEYAALLARRDRDCEGAALLPDVQQASAGGRPGCGRQTERGNESEMRSFDAPITERSRARREIRDARLPLCLRYCCECGSLVEVRKGAMDAHVSNRKDYFCGDVIPLCPGKRWRR